MALRRNLRILAIFIHNSLWGKRIRGDERRFLELTKRWKSYGAKIYVLEREPSIQASYFGENNVYVSIPISLGIESKQGVKVFLQFLLRLFLLLRLLIKLRKVIDIIYVYNQDFFNLIYGFICMFITRKPMIIVIQSTQDFKFPLRDLIKIYRLTSPIDIILLAMHKIISKNILKFASVIFTVSNTLKHEIIKYLGPREVIVTGNGVDHGKFRPVDIVKVYDAVFLGRIDFAQKGLDTLLKAWYIVTRMRPEAKLAIVGGFESEMDRWLLFKYIDLLKLHNNVFIFGFVNDEKLVEILSKSKIFIFPSRFEGYGLSVVEAMACGLPCILSNLEVLKELHEGVATFVPVNNYVELSKKILEMLDLSKVEYEVMRNLVLTHAKGISWNYVALKELAVMNIIGKTY